MFVGSILRSDIYTGEMIENTDGDPHGIAYDGFYQLRDFHPMDAITITVADEQEVHYVIKYYSVNGITLYTLRDLHDGSTMDVAL